MSSRSLFDDDIISTVFSGFEDESDSDQPDGDQSVGDQSDGDEGREKDRTDYQRSAKYPLMVRNFASSLL